MTCPLCGGDPHGGNCARCNGNGCTTCGGAGEVPCPGCHGTGEAELPVRCAWCMDWIERGSPALRERGHVSHGICPGCYAEVRSANPDACWWGVADDCTGKAIHPHGACAPCKAVCELMADGLEGAA